MKARGTPKGSIEWSEYKKHENKCTNLVRSAEMKYWKDKFSDSNSSKSFWKIVNEFKGKKKTNKIGSLK